MEQTGGKVIEASLKGWAQTEFDQIWGAVFGESDPQQARRAVVFTAAGRREGVSELVAGTALTGAALGARVALVDLNVRFPRLARLLGAAQAPGLADVAAGQADLASVGQAVGLANLVFYSAGDPSTSALNLMSGERLGQIIAQLRRQHEYVLCDCAAANACPDAALLAPLADGVVLVAQAGATRREALVQARKRIEAARGRVLGVILNRRRYVVPGFLYRRG